MSAPFAPLLCRCISADATGMWRQFKPKLEWPYTAIEIHYYFESNDGTKQALRSQVQILTPCICLVNSQCRMTKDPSNQLRIMFSRKRKCEWDVFPSFLLRRLFLHFTNMVLRTTSLSSGMIHITWIIENVSNTTAAKLSQYKNGKIDNNWDFHATWCTSNK